MAGSVKASSKKVVVERPTDDPKWSSRRECLCKRIIIALRSLDPAAQILLAALSKSKLNKRKGVPGGFERWNSALHVPKWSAQPHT